MGLIGVQIRGETRCKKGNIRGRKMPFEQLPYTVHLWLSICGETTTPSSVFVIVFWSSLALAGKDVMYVRQVLTAVHIQLIVAAGQQNTFYIVLWFFDNCKKSNIAYVQ